MRFLTAITLGLSLASGAVLAAPAAPAAPAVPPAPPAGTRPPMVEPARDWPAFLATAEVDSSLETYEVLRKLYDPKGGMLADCGQHLAELDAALRVVPVGIALWRGGEMCARQGKDESAAAFYGEGVSRLATFALSKDSSGPWNPPIRVFRMDDISALVDATGMEVLHAYDDRSRAPRYLVMTYAMWDEESGQERHLGFDFLDTLFQLRNSERFAGYPAYRRSMRKAFEANMSARGDAFGNDLLAASAARELDNRGAVSRLRATAEAGGLASLRLWIGNCAVRPYEGCADGLVDALLPFAEQQQSMYGIQLALAYARGIGVKQDMDAAMTLLDAAERRWSGGNAYAQFAEQLMAIADGPLPAPVMERLQRAAAAGSGRAGMARMNSLLEGHEGDKLPADILAVVEALAERGFAEARIAAFEHYGEAGDWPRAIAWLRRAADDGDADAMERLASELLLGEHAPRDLAGGRELMRKAAMAGDVAAMGWLADMAFRDKRWADAEVWYASGLAYEDEDAVSGLLRLYEEKRQGLDKGPADAIAIYDSIHAAGDAKYRRMYADFLLHKAPSRDPAKARRLLAIDADKGDGHSQIELARAMILGEFGKPELEAGLALAEKAMAADDKGEIADRYAFFLYYRQPIPGARKRALEIERALLKRKYTPAMNNLGWWLCTSADPQVRAPAEGLAVVKQMGDPYELGVSSLDTVAACHAAVGEFERAVELETRVSERSALFPLSAEEGELERRLQGFRDKRAYTEPADHVGE